MHVPMLPCAHCGRETNYDRRHLAAKCTHCMTKYSKQTKIPYFRMSSWEKGFYPGNFWPWLGPIDKAWEDNAKIQSLLCLSSLSPVTLGALGHHQAGRTDHYFTRGDLSSSLFGSWKTEVLMILSMSLRRQLSNVNLVLHSPDLEETTLQRGKRQMPISRRSPCSFQLGKISVGRE